MIDLTELMRISDGLPGDTLVLRELGQRWLSASSASLGANLPEGYEALLAGSLNNLAVRLSGLGQRKALDAAQEAVDTSRPPLRGNGP